MRIIIKLLLGLVALVVVLALVSFLLPRHVAVERSIAINAAPEAIFPQVNALKAAEGWSPWLSRDPNIQITYEGPESGVGNKSSWQSDVPNVGSGSQEITLSTENERVEMALDFGSQGTADAYFQLTPEGEATNVTWGFTSDMGMNPLGRWMGLMMDKWVGGDYETGLANLKSLAEGG